MEREKHEFVIYTDKQLDQCESPYPFVNKVTREWTMWLDLDEVTTTKNQILVLEPVESKAMYTETFKLRKKIEKAFGIKDEAVIKSFILDIEKMTKRFQGKWYLAKFENKFVGQIGLVPFNYQGKPVGRLKDVDIIPEYQNKGLGKQLLQSIFAIAKGSKLKALCLTADADNWPKDWYLKSNFKKVGECIPE